MEPDLDQLEFSPAKTIPEMPHEYVVRSPANWGAYVRSGCSRPSESAASISGRDLSLFRAG